MFEGDALVWAAAHLRAVTLLGCCCRFVRLGDRVEVQ